MLINILNNNIEINLLIIFIILDVLFGLLASIKEKKINSTIGINGIIRKIGMILSIFFCLILDYFVKIDLIGFLPDELKNILNIKKVGISFFFNILYIIFEILSVFNNMERCNLPLPLKIKKLFNKILNEFTNEKNKY